MRFFENAPDGGSESGVTGFYLIEIKSLFSIVLLRFEPKVRKVFHNHAFNAVTWILRGELEEERIYPSVDVFARWRRYRPSIFPKLTSRANVHRVHTTVPTLTITFRGPWWRYWVEYRPEISPKGHPVGLNPVTLTHGREEVK